MIDIHHSSKKNCVGGYIALVAVLIAGGIMLVAALASSRTGVIGANAASAEEHALRARALADACAEEAIVRLRANLAYAGNESVTVSSTESCMIRTITGSGATNRTILTDATVSGYVRHVSVTLATVTPVLAVSLWKLTPN